MRIGGRSKFRRRMLPWRNRIGLPFGYGRKQKTPTFPYVVPRADRKYSRLIVLRLLRGVPLPHRLR